MDTKTIRRNFYKNKLYLSDKLDQKYTAERFPEDVQFLLDEYIPKATLKQLTKFMAKKVDRILKLYPEVEKALKKVIRDKLNKIPQEIKKAQVQKLLKHLKEHSEGYEILQKQKDEYEFVSETKNPQGEVWRAYLFEGIKIMIPKSLQMYIDATTRTVIGKGFYKVIHQNPENRLELMFASTFEIQQYKIEVKNGNFEREVNNFLEKLNLFMQKMKLIENPEE